MHNTTQSTSLVALVAGALLAGSAGASAQTAAAPADKAPLWQKSAALGFSLTRGNSSTMLLTGNIGAARKQDKNEVLLGADAAYGKNSGVKNAESLRAFAQYNRLFGHEDRWYGYGRVDGLHDAIADTSYRIGIGLGLGYYIIKEKNTTLAVEVGPGFVHEHLGHSYNSYATLRIAERFEHKFNEKTRLWQTAEFLPQIDRWGNYVANAEIGLETDLSKNLSLRTYVQDSYRNEPAVGRKKNDIKFVTAVAYKF